MMIKSKSRRWARSVLNAALVIFFYGCAASELYAQNGPDSLPQLSESEAEWVADQIFNNECARRMDCLTSWNAGEDFPSLGIGHFIWYREGQQERFVESFPQLLAYYVSRGEQLPAWLAGLPGWESPWSDRQTFLEARQGAQLSELRAFLYDTRATQTAFIMQRMEESLPKLMQASDRPEAVQDLFYRIANTSSPYGMYTLIDYVNFKGEGTALSERYQGEGWGLLQVLEFMLDNPPILDDESALLEQFAAAARAVLARRIANAPAERNESRWRDGWNNRTFTYVP
ncbi:hypothetical protein QGM61_07590 [Pseudohongiella sp. SYSU M77423]|uniref:hypothetical protein n=1 Tax=Pseudohongiella sp. SYSU M77423 TaxID=3042312 RepID=UPI00248193A3|nr:hypothetical protein [Pseudohongiella sp. SYSU M77423]MDH7943680.1 hypothetical protein [Pseudohongiella sp. SYSU M77423]